MNTKSLGFDVAILVTEENLDKIALVNEGLRPEVETPIAIYIIHGDQNIPNTILSQADFFDRYETRPIPKRHWFKVTPKTN